MPAVVVDERSTTGANVVVDALVVEDGDRVVVDLPASLPPGVGARLAAQAFSHPAVRPGRAVLVVLPRGESEALEWLRTRVDGARARVAGVTCLVEGRVPRVLR